MNRLLNKAIWYSLIGVGSLSFVWMIQGMGNYGELQPSVTEQTVKQREISSDIATELLTTTVISDLRIEAKSEFNLADHINVTSSKFGNATNRAKLSHIIDTTKLGEQKVIVEIKDLDNNLHYETLIFIIEDTIPPKITISDKELFIGESLDVLKDVKVIDAVDGDLTEHLIVSSDVNTNQAGDYNITYQVIDKSGNMSEHIRKITVLETVNPKEVAGVEEELGSSTMSTAEAVMNEEYVENKVAQRGMASQRIQFLGYDIPYENGGMSAGQGIIDSGYIASTWGGNSIQSGNDQANTHFIGHNPGIFSSLFSLSYGAEISISDSVGAVSIYQVTNIFEVDDYAVGLHDGVSYWDLIIGSSGGERVTFQTCITDTTNLIVQATWVR